MGSVGSCVGLRNDQDESVERSPLRSPRLSPRNDMRFAQDAAAARKVDEQQRIPEPSKLAAEDRPLRVPKLPELAAEASHYEILGVGADFTESQLTRAYRQKSLTYHPDKGGNSESFKRISLAYQTLRDPKTRQQYDITGASGGSRRNSKSTVDVAFEERFGRKSVDEVFDELLGVKKRQNAKKSSVATPACVECSGRGVKSEKVQLFKHAVYIETPCTACTTVG